MKKILVVSNDFDHMVLLKNWLQRKGYSVEFTANARKIYSIINNFYPNLFLLDISQSEVAIDLKGTPETKNIPLLLMTGYAFRDRYYHIPADDTIEKPFDPGLLIKKIEKLTLEVGITKL